MLLVGIDSEYLKTYFKPKISKSKNFSRAKFFKGLCRFWPNWRKMANSKHFGRKHFLVEIDSECFKEYLEYTLYLY